MMVLTAARPKGRQAAVLLTYEKTDISEEIAPDLESFKYTDVAESKSDSVSITVNAKAAKWKNDWMPEKGVKLYPAIVVKDWNIGGIESGYRDYSAECGAFVLDDLSFAGAPDSLTMGGVAKPNDTSFSERNRTFTWKNTSVKKIAETIAGRYKLELKFEGDDHSIDAKEQDGTDSAFLQDLCSTYALVIKVYTSKLWVYDREKYKAKDPVWTVYESRPVGNPTALCVEPGSFKWNTKLTGTYTGGLYTYTNKQKKININVKVGTDERQLKLTGKALIKEQVDGGTGGYYGSYELTLAADGWKPARNEDDYENAGGMDYYQCIYDAELSDSTSELVPVGVVSPGSFYTTTKAGVLNGCETHDGFIRFFSQRIPEADIQATVTLFGKGGGSGETGSVSIGQGLKRDASGAIAVRIGEGLDFDSANALTVRKETVMTSEDLLNEEETQQEIVDMLK